MKHREHISKLIVLPDEWTIVNGLLNPILKIKRKMIDASFGDRYETWGKRAGVVVFA